jgi:hypothetical protein
VTLSPSAPTSASQESAGDHEERRAALLFVLRFAALAVLLSGVVPLALLAEVPDTGRSAAWPLTMLVAVWAGLRMSALIADGRPRLFDFFFWMFCYVFMGIAPTVQMRSGLIATTTPDIDPGYDLPVSLFVVLGIGCYEAGRLLALSIERRRGADAALAPLPVSRGRSGALLAVALLLSAYFVASVGLGPLLGSREAASAAREARWADSSTRGVVYALAIYPLTVAVGSMVQVRKLAEARHRFALLVVLLCAAAVLLVVVNPIGTARYNFATVLFALAVYAGATSTRFRTRITLMAALLGLIFLFPIADAFRRSTDGNFSRGGFFDEYQSNGDYDAFWQIANAYSYVLDGLMQPFRQLLGSLLFWMPRSIWADKPQDTGVVLAQYRGYSFENLSAPLWAEFLVNGGIPLIAVGFLIVGYALRRMDSRLLPAFSQTGLWAVVGAIFPVYMTILLRGSLLQATGYVAVAILSLLFVRGKTAPPAAIPGLSGSGVTSTPREGSGPPPASTSAPGSPEPQSRPWLDASPGPGRGRKRRR